MKELSILPLPAVTALVLVRREETIAKKRDEPEGSTRIC
jgi:hypothetical protein